MSVGSIALNRIDRALALAVMLALTGLVACHKSTPSQPFLTAAVQRRNIVVSSQASGTLEPDTVIEVKSKAAGEVLEVRAAPGQFVRRGDLLVRIDQRQLRNTVAQAEADLEAAQTSLAAATAAKGRADTLYDARVITRAEHEQATTAWASAKSSVVRTRVTLENARIQLDEADIRAPVTGTIIEQSVERGQIVSSATTNVGGGSVLMKMADISLMQVRTFVDETDIGKILPGQSATITVDAFPNRTFAGNVIKIEPTPQTQQNVTMFPVLVRIPNAGGRLQPGMNCDVEIHIGRRDGVLAIPYAALRTTKDVASAAAVLGLTMDSVSSTLSRAEARSATQPETTISRGRGPRPPQSDQRGVMVPLVDSAAGEVAEPGDTYIVFVLRKGAPTPVRVRTGLTDLDWTEVVSGITSSDTVLVLPSAGLAQSQQQFQERVSRMAGGALGGLRQQAPGTGAAAAPATRR